MKVADANRRVRIRRRFIGALYITPA